ncbi:hypothetical protein HU755_27290, partial [Pseudomonas sp. SWRI111]
MEKEKNIPFYLMFFLIISVTVLLMKTVSVFQQFEYTEIGYIFPAAMAVMLIKILMEEKSAIMVT